MLEPKAEFSSVVFMCDQWLQDNAPTAGGSSRKYADSIESLVRNNIQKTKIDMANEVIDAGRFNMATTQEERKETLEALLQARRKLASLNESWLKL